MQRKTDGGGQGPTTDESQELARFRQEWLAELKARKASASTGEGPVQPVHHAHQASPVPAPTTGATSSAAPTAATVPAVSLASLQGVTAPLSDKQATALNAYRRAAEHEQRGELDDAIVLYRQAFRIVRKSPPLARHHLT